ncbi:MAG: helix-turn-helix domain-containing protein [Minicystis sp.]
MSILFPPADLAASVDFFWSVPRGGPRGAPFHELLPDGGVHLALRVSASGCRAALIGPATERAVVRIEPGSTYLGIRFRTGLAPRLADVRAPDLTNASVELTHLAGRTIDSIGDQLQSSREPASPWRLVEELLRRPAPPLVTEARCRDAAALVAARGGRIQVEDMARELGLGTRTLERVLMNGLGISPKRLIRLARLRHLLGALRDRRHETLAELAHACGYADQAHMNRDFRKLTGRAPGERDAFQARPLSRAEARILHARR